MASFSPLSFSLVGCLLLTHIETDGMDGKSFTMDSAVSIWRDECLSWASDAMRRGCCSATKVVQSHLFSSLFCPVSNIKRRRRRRRRVEHSFYGFKWHRFIVGLLLTRRHLFCCIILFDVIVQCPARRTLKGGTESFFFLASRDACPFLSLFFSFSFSLFFLSILGLHRRGEEEAFSLLSLSSSSPPTHGDGDSDGSASLHGGLFPSSSSFAFNQKSRFTSSSSSSSSSRSLKRH